MHACCVLLRDYICTLHYYFATAQDYFNVLFLVYCINAKLATLFIHSYQISFLFYRNHALGICDLSENNFGCNRCFWLGSLNVFLTNTAITRLSGSDTGGPRAHRVCIAPVRLFSKVCVQYVCRRKAWKFLFDWYHAESISLKQRGAFAQSVSERKQEEEEVERWQGVMFSQQCYVAESDSSTNTKTLLGDAGNNTIQKDTQS